MTWPEVFQLRQAAGFCWMPAALTSLAKLASSDLINAANCSGVFPIGS